MTHGTPIQRYARINKVNKVKGWATTPINVKITHPTIAQ